MADRVRPIGMDLEPSEIADDQQRRVLECRRVALELGKGSSQILALALVLPTETPTFPDICPAFAAGGLGDALFKGVPLASRVGGGRRLLAEEIVGRENATVPRRARSDRPSAIWR